MRFSILSRVTTTLFLLTICCLTTLSYIKKNINSTYQNIALLQTKNVITKVVNQVILENINDKEISLNYTQEEYVSYDVKQINNLVSSLSSQVVYVLDNINKGDYSNVVDNQYFDKYNYSGIIYELEFFKLFNNIFISSLGSKYPVKFKLTSDVLTSCDLEVEEFGINNALIKLNLLLLFSFSLVLPLTINVNDMELRIPLSMILVEGDVPSFLYGNHTIEGVNSYINEVESL
jgi:sporulation protein YunB